MRLHLAAIGKLKAGPERDLSARYLDRFAKAGRGIGLDLGPVIERVESRAGDAGQRKREEGDSLVAALPAGALLWALDETGDALDSAGFAAAIAALRDAGQRDLALVIGGPDGHDPQLLASVERRLSFGRMTWPHQMVRIMAAEQLYRAVTILSGHPYHRA
jgi:23S rRNA (pseudouridine1915-N3)-methyltransferase